MKTYTLDEISEKCGFFNPTTVVNNGYGCNNKECGDWEYVKADDDEKYIKNRINIRKILARQKFGSFHNIKSKQSEVVEYLANAQFNDDVLLSINVKKQGKCLSCYCPIAYTSDEESESSFDGDTIMELMEGIELSD